MRYLNGLILAALLVAPAAALEAGGHDRSNGCREVQCPRCDHACKFSVDVGKEAKNCYSSECKAICIPKVVFPWQTKPCRESCGGCDSCSAAGCGASGGGQPCCTVNNGACVRRVNVLKKFQYECEACKYQWEAVRAGCGGNGCGDRRSAPAIDDSSPPSASPADAASTRTHGLLRYITF